MADALGITSVFLHPYAGVLSAFGMGLADIRTFEEAVMEKPLEGWWAFLPLDSILLSFDRHFFGLLSTSFIFNSVELTCSECSCGVLKVKTTIHPNCPFHFFFCFSIETGAGVGGGSSLGGEGVSVGGVGSNEPESSVDMAFVDIFDKVVSEAVAGVRAQMLDEVEINGKQKEVFVACRAQLRYQVLITWIHAKHVAALFQGTMESCVQGIVLSFFILSAHFLE